MQVFPATVADLQAATECMVAAFPNDLNLGAFFDDSPMGRTAATAQFFAMLLEARIRLHMPALVAKDGDRLVGIVMGDDTTKPIWPDDLQQRWEAFEAASPLLAHRFAVYDQIVADARLDRPHYNLGVLAVRPECQGLGVGKALISAFLSLSDLDEHSEGTAIETASPANVALYDQFGFQARASGPLETVTLWCLYRPKPMSQALP